MAEEVKLCSTCGETKPHTAFHRCERQRLQARCKKCKSEWSKNHYKTNEQYRTRVKDNAIRRRYGLSVDDVDALREAQNGECAVCRNLLTGGRREHIDHDHVTGRVRGILCSECNTGIGKLKDDPRLLKRAAEYLERVEAMEVNYGT